MQETLLALASHLEGDGGGSPEDWREQALITLACHTSVRAGQRLTLEELRGLLVQLDACDEPRTCPHGRPLLVHLPPAELEQRFGRRG
jgi:DNA mismatch repair protein MutL